MKKIMGLFKNQPVDLIAELKKEYSEQKDHASINLPKLNARFKQNDNQELNFSEIKKAVFALQLNFVEIPVSTMQLIINNPQQANDIANAMNKLAQNQLFNVFTMSLIEKKPNQAGPIADILIQLKSNDFSMKQIKRILGVKPDAANAVGEKLISLQKEHAELVKKGVEEWFIKAMYPHVNDIKGVLVKSQEIKLIDFVEQLSYRNIREKEYFLVIENDNTVSNISIHPSDRKKFEDTNRVVQTLNEEMIPEINDIIKSYLLSEASEENNSICSIS